MCLPPALSSCPGFLSLQASVLWLCALPGLPCPGPYCLPSTWSALLLPVAARYPLLPMVTHPHLPVLGLLAWCCLSSDGGFSALAPAVLPGRHTRAAPGLEPCCVSTPVSLWMLWWACLLGAQLPALLPCTSLPGKAWSWIAEWPFNPPAINYGGRRVGCVPSCAGG